MKNGYDFNKLSDLVVLRSIIKNYGQMYDINLIIKRLKKLGLTTEKIISCMNTLRENNRFLSINKYITFNELKNMTDYEMIECYGGNTKELGYLIISFLCPIEEFFQNYNIYEPRFLMLLEQINLDSDTKKIIKKYIKEDYDSSSYLFFKNNFNINGILLNKQYMSNTDKIKQNIKEKCNVELNFISSNLISKILGYKHYEKTL